MEELTFAPDRRSVQTVFYHFSDRPSGEPDRRGFSQQDSLALTLDKIYQTKFRNISRDFRSTLVNILITEVPLEYRNLELLAAANFIVYHMMINSVEFTPETFDKYFNFVSGSLIPNMTGKKPEEREMLRVKFKLTLLRYIIYVKNNTQRS